MFQGQTSGDDYDDWANDVLALPRQIQKICGSSKLCCPNQCVILRAFLSSIAFYVQTHWQSTALATTAAGKHEKRKSMVMGEKLIDVLNCGVEFLKRCATQDSVSALLVSIGQLNWIVDSVAGYSKMMNKLLAHDLKELQDEIESHCRTAQDQLLAAYKKDKELMDSLIKQNASKDLSKLEDLYSPAPVMDVLLDFDRNLTIADSVLFVESQFPVERSAIIPESVVSCMTEFGVIHGLHIGNVSGHLKRRTLILKYMQQTRYRNEYLCYGVDMMLQIATAMRYPDRYNVIHIDLKPSDSTLVQTQTQTQTDLQTQADSDVYIFGRLWELVIRQKWDRSGVNDDDIKAIIHRCLDPEQHKRPTFEDICNRLWDLKEKMLLTYLEGLEINEFESLEKVIRVHWEKNLEEHAYGISTSKEQWGNRPVSIKEFPKQSDCYSEFEKYHSLRTHGLNTTHIVQVLGQIHLIDRIELKASGKKYIHRRDALVLELMAIDLKRKIEIRKELRRKSSPFSLNESIDIMYQIAKGIHNIHEVNAVHKDIKTASIFLNTLQDGSLIVKLTDLRNSYCKPACLEAWTKEEAENLRKEDVCSFGLVCIEILTGVQPDLEGGKMPCLTQGIPHNLGMIIRSCLEPHMQELPTFEKIYKDLGSLREQWKPIPLIPLIANSELVIQPIPLIPLIASSELVIPHWADLGSGGYGVVSKAHWGSQPVAIKEFKHVEHFKHEYEIYNAFKTIDGLATTHIVQVLGHTVSNHRKLKSSDRYALVIELMDTDLKKLIEIRQQNSPFTLKESIDIMYQIAKGIDNLHKVDVVHRDIKPANVLLKTMQDRSVIVKLTDCGTCKVDFHTHSDHTHRTGTKIYRAPEMEEEGAQISRKVDIYSFGVVCIEILTGKPPDAENLKRREMPSFPQDIPDLAIIIRRCIEQEIPNRPTSEEICKDLSKLREQQLKDYDSSMKGKRRRLK